MKCKIKSMYSISDQYRYPDIDRYDQYGIYGYKERVD